MIVLMENTLVLTDPERMELNQRMASRSGRADDARRARLMLLLEADHTWAAIRDKLDCNDVFIDRWSKRFAQERLAGLFSRHSGQEPSTLTPALEARILQWTVKRKPPDGSTQWSTRKLAEQLGAAATIDSNDPETALARARRLAPKGWDCVIECTGLQAPLDLASELVRERGRLVIAGYHQDGRRQVDMQSWNWRGIDVVNAHERDERLVVDAMREAARGIFDIQRLITHELPLARLGDAFELARTRPPGFVKAVVLT